MKRVICLCSLMLMLFAGTVAFAEAVQPLYLEADRVSVSLDINCDGAATCKGKVRAKHNNVTMNITLTLKKSSDGKAWKSVKSWNESGNGLLGASIEEACAVSKGYQYKEVMSAKIYDSTGHLLESLSKTSPVKSY